MNKNLLMFVFVVAISGVIILGYKIDDHLINNKIPTTEEEYQRLANYTIKTTEDDFKLSKNIIVNCGVFFPDDINCKRELRKRILDEQVKGE